MDKKATALAILKILEDTDANHQLSREQIEQKLLSRFGISVDRRTIYSNIELLEDFGYEIYKPNDTKDKGYYLGSRVFEESEIELLCNAIHSSRFIPINYSKDLINKLLATQSKAFKKDYNDEVFLDNGDKKENKDFFLNIETISEAIKNKNNISFDYMKYDINIKLVKKSEERRQVSPHHLIYTNDKVYLIAYSLDHKMIRHFRVDRIMNIKIEDGKYVSEPSKNDPYQYAKTKMYMYAGDDIPVTIRFKTSILDDIVDNFGKKITVVKDGNDYYKTTIKSSRQGMIYFALQFLENIQVVSPKDLKDEIKNILAKGLKDYK